MKSNLELEQSLIGMGIRKAAQTVLFGDFTDNENTTGDLLLDKAVPVGAFVIGTKVTVVSAFDEDTSAAMTVGKTAGADEFSDGTSISVLATGKFGDSAEDLMEFIASATDVYLRITGSSDFTLLAAGGGKMYVEVFYLST